MYCLFDLQYLVQKYMILIYGSGSRTVFLKGAIGPFLAMKAYGGVEEYVHSFLTSSFDGGT